MNSNFNLLQLKDNDDIDYQKSRTSMSGRWYGFEHFYSPIHYTACITDEAGVVLQGTCKYVGAEKNTTLNRAQLQLFEVIVLFPFNYRYINRKVS